MTDVATLPDQASSLPRPTPASQPPTATGPTLDWVEAERSDAAPSWRPSATDAGLTLVTLGLYRAVVRTRVRQHIAQSVRICGAPMQYTGTVRELLMPALAILGGVALVLLALGVAKLLAVPRPKITPSPWRLLVTVPLIYVLGLSAWRQRAFLLSRLWLVSGPGHLGGQPHAYAWRHFLTGLGVGPTLGWIIPWRQVLLHQRLIGEMSLGGHRFSFTGSVRPLLGRFAVAWAGVIVIYLAAVLALAVAMGPKIVAAKQAGTWPALDAGEMAMAAMIGLAAGAAVGLLCAWYRIHTLRTMAAATRLDGRPLRLDVATGDYLWLVLTNGLLRAGSLFLLGPTADVRQARFLLSRLRIN